MNIKTTTYSQRAQERTAQHPYTPPASAEHLTFDIVAASRYEMWLWTTFTAWAGTAFWADNLVTTPIPMRLTNREDTLALPELRWLAERVFRCKRGGDCVRMAEPAATMEAHQDVRLDVLVAQANWFHKYLDMFDRRALLGRLADEHAVEVQAEVLSRTVPSVACDIDTFELHLRVCVECARLTYYVDGFEL